MIHFVIGTTSEYKIHAIKKALYELDFEFEVKSVNVESGVSDQPKSAGETKQGSINRAKNALEKVKAADAGIGVEFGYEPIDDRFHIVCWASIVTKDSIVFSEHSSSLELPGILKERLLNDEDVSNGLQGLFENQKDIEMTRILKTYLKKRRVIYECVTNVALRFLFDKNLY